MRSFFAPSRALAAKRRREGGPRIYDPRERAVLATIDAFARPTARLLGLSAAHSPPPVTAVRRILALRLDRIGDLLMTLPALAALRRLAPDAEIELAVGSWNEDIARGLPFVDRLRVVDVPWSSWGKRARWSSALEALRAGPRPDLMIDFQGDLRVLFLMALCRPPLRAGYGDTGGGYLLTHRGVWDEKLSWYRQNVQLLGAIYPKARFPDTIEPINFLGDEDRRQARQWLEEIDLADAARPRVGVHPSAGRPIKQWEIERFSAVVDRLREERSAAVVLTGSPTDRDLVEAVASRSKTRPRVLLGDRGLRCFAAAIEQLDLFITGDTGAMHLAHAVRTPTVAIFGPSDPARYGPEGKAIRWSAVREELYCSPCNMIRRPPAECRNARPPECLDRISVARVEEAALRWLPRVSAREGS